MATLGAIKRAAQAALDDGGVYLVTSAATATVTINNLIDFTPDASEHRFDGAWVYVSTGAGAGQSRRVVAGGYTPLTGVLDLELSWSIVPSAADEIEITHLFPGLSGSNVAVPPEDTDYRTLVVRALAKLLVPDRITTAITTADTYALTTWVWLDRPERLVRVLEPAPRSGRAPIDASWRGPRIVADGPAPFLQLHVPFETASGSLTLEVLRPGHTLVDGAESTIGPIIDASTVIPQVDDVLPQVLAEAYQALGARSPGRPFPNADKLMAFWQGEAKKRRYYDKSTDPPQPAAQTEAA